jgi:hypothetical protein
MARLTGNGDADHVTLARGGDALNVPTAHNRPAWCAWHTPHRYPEKDSMGPHPIAFVENPVTNTARIVIVGGGLAAVRTPHRDHAGPHRLGHVKLSHGWFRARVVRALFEATPAVRPPQCIAEIREHVKVWPAVAVSVEFAPAARLFIYSPVHASNSPVLLWIHGVASSHIRPPVSPTTQ